MKIGCQHDYLHRQKKFTLEKLHQCMTTEGQLVARKVFRSTLYGKAQLLINFSCKFKCYSPNQNDSAPLDYKKRSIIPK